MASLRLGVGLALIVVGCGEGPVSSDGVDSASDVDDSYADSVEDTVSAEDTMLSDSTPNDAGAIYYRDMVLHGAECPDAAPVVAPYEFPIPQLSDDVSCGFDEATGYIGPCDIEIGPNWRSTLCDEDIGKCVAPKASCGGGWCTIPKRSFLSGVSADNPSPYALDARVSFVPRAIRMQQTEVTQADFAKVMGYLPDNENTCGQCPVGGVSVFDAMAYANRLGASEGLEPCYVLEGCSRESVSVGVTSLSYDIWLCDSSSFVGPACKGYRLPSRLEWELAAGAGSPYCLPVGPLPAVIGPTTDGGPCGFVAELAPWVTYCGTAIDCSEECVWPHGVDPYGDRVWCSAPQPVTSASANAFGLFGMFGNVSEYVQDTSGAWSDAADSSDSSPLEVERLDSFAQAIERYDAPIAMGGSHIFQIPGSCRWSAINLSPEAGQHVSGKIAGFRLVQTSP